MPFLKAKKRRIRLLMGSEIVQLKMMRREGRKKKEKKKILIAERLHGERKKKIPTSIFGKN